MNTDTITEALSAETSWARARAHHADPAGADARTTAHVEALRQAACAALVAVADEYGVDVPEARRLVSTEAQRRLMTPPVPTPHVLATGCGLTREDFGWPREEDVEPCVDGGFADEHPTEDGTR